MKNKKKPARANEKAKIKYPHFRFLKYKEGPPSKKRKHPKLILEKDNDMYHYMGMTESAKRGRHKNIELTKNPKRGDTRPAYIRKEYLIRPTKDFHGIQKDYSLCSEDEARVLSEAQKLKAKKKEVSLFGGSH